MSTFGDIEQQLAGVVDFELSVGDSTTVIRKNAPDSWTVYLDEDLIGSFSRHERDRATYYESEIAAEPGTTNWVSDDVTTLVSRMVTLRD